jgi:LPS-assembly lipoprotein
MDCFVLKCGLLSHGLEHLSSARAALIFRSGIVILIAFSVHACGFHLRGELSLTGDIAPVYLQQNSVFELAREIKSLLVTNKIKIVENSSDAKTQLSLLNEAKNTRVLSVDGSGQAREYLLTYRVNFAIKLQQSKQIKESVSVSRALLFNSTAVLGTTNEAGILFEEMRAQAARLILLKLQAVSRNQALNKATLEDEASGLTSETPALDAPASDNRDKARQ